MHPNPPIVRVFYFLTLVLFIRVIFQLTVLLTGGEAMTRMSTIYSRLSYGTGTALTGCGVSAKAYADTAKTEVWILADKIAGLTLSDWAIMVGIACTIITCGVNWYYRRKEREDRLNGYATKAEE